MDMPATLSVQLQLPEGRSPLAQRHAERSRPGMCNNTLLDDFLSGQYSQSRYTKLAQNSPDLVSRKRILYFSCKGRISPQKVKTKMLFSEHLLPLHKSVPGIASALGTIKADQLTFAFVD
jgi:hypothetical protein